MSDPLPITATHRGFAIAKFIDYYDVPCSLQKSSLATEDCVWLGCDDLGLRRLVPGEGWQPVNDDTISGNTRMHLTREMVARILPSLRHFVATGDLPPAQEASATAPANPVRQALSDEEIALELATWLRGVAASTPGATDRELVLARAIWLEEIADRAQAYAGRLAPAGELKPCPFCKSTTLRMERADSPEPCDCWVACLRCEAIGPSRPTFAEAESSWNART